MDFKIGDIVVLDLPDDKNWDRVEMKVTNIEGYRVFGDLTKLNPNFHSGRSYHLGSNVMFFNKHLIPKGPRKPLTYKRALDLIKGVENASN